MIAMLAALAAIPFHGPDLSTPTSTVASFSTALSDDKLLDASLCVQQGVFGDAAKPLEKFLEQHPIKWTIEVKDSQLDGDDAKLSCTLTMEKLKEPDAAPMVGAEELVSLHHDPEGWHIVPRTLQQVQADYEAAKNNPNQHPDFAKAHVITSLTTAFRYEEFMVGMVQGFVKAGHQIDVLTKMKNLALAVLKFTNDKNGGFPTNQEHLKDDLAPYLKKEKDVPILDLIQDHDGVVWMLNATLLGKSLDSIQDPDKTVMLYESDHGRLGFNYDGKALVALANGTTRFVTEAQSLKLFWQPKN